MSGNRGGSSRVLARVGMTLGIALVLVGAVWLTSLSLRSMAQRSEPVEAPIAAIEVSGDVGSGAGADGSEVTPAPASVRVDDAWSSRVASATGIPRRALDAYAAAELVIDAEQPACGVGWNTLAGIGAIETDHGRHGGAVLGDEGYPMPAIRGPQLDGNGNAAIADTDGGAWDGDPVWDRAVGPMQFIPDTWSRWGADANGDGASDPNQIDDAALAAARYLCHSGEMSSVDGWRTAIFSYNHLDTYVDDVAAVANSYALAAR